MSRLNGSGEPEVIVAYGDGLAYSKHKMEDAFRPGGFLEKPPIKHSAAPAKESVTLKKEDVDVIVHEFEVTKAQAEKILSEAGGDLKQALESLIYPKP